MIRIINYSSKFQIEKRIILKVKRNSKTCIDSNIIGTNFFKKKKNKPIRNSRKSLCSRFTKTALKAKFQDAEDSSPPLPHPRIPHDRLNRFKYFRTSRECGS